MSPKKIIVIGAGLGGLCTAALLARDGHDVTVLEKNSRTGGRARVLKQKGFVFDMGPSWYLMPEVFERFFALFDKTPADYFKLKRLDPNYRVFSGNKEAFDIPSDRYGLDRVFESLESDGSIKLERYMKIASAQYEIAMKDFIYRPFSSALDLFNINILTNGLKLHVLENLDKFAKRFFSNIDARKVLEYTTVFLGSSPYNTPALYSIMSHVDFDLGVWYPMGGIGKIVKAVEDICLESGVTILLNHEVHQIGTENGSAKFVFTDKGAFNADIVVVNADYQHADSVLIGQDFRSYSDRYWETRKMGPSAFILYLGLDKRIDNLQHHNLFFSSSWDEHFKTLFDDPKWPQDPSYYICCPSKTDPSVAPADCENLFILVPVASGLKDDEETRKIYTDKIISHLESLTRENIRDHIIYQKTFAHNDFSSDYHAYKGTALGLSHTLFQTAIFRPAFKSKKLKNVYFTGSYTHPGIGMPMVMISAQIVSDIITKGVS